MQRLIVIAILLIQFYPKPHSSLWDFVWKVWFFHRDVIVSTRFNFTRLIGDIYLDLTRILSQRSYFTFLVGWGPELTVERSIGSRAWWPYLVWVRIGDSYVTRVCLLSHWSTKRIRTVLICPYLSIQGLSLTKRNGPDDPT